MTPVGIPKIHWARIECVLVFFFLLGIVLPTYAHNFVVRFEQPSYTILLDQPLTVRVVIDPVVHGGLFSYGFQLNLPTSTAPNASVASIVLPPELNFNGVTPTGAITTIGASSAAVKGTVNAFANPVRTYSQPLLATFTITNLPLGAHLLQLAPHNTLGPAERIFVDGEGTVLDTNITFGTASITIRPPPPPLEIITLVPVLNRQSGLFEQIVRIRGAGGGNTEAYRIFIRNLRSDVTVYNASGTTNGIPFVQHNIAIPAGQSVDLTIEYYVPDRRPIEPSLELVIVAASPPLVPLGSIFAVDRSLRLPNGTFFVEFSTLLDRSYFVEYSRDMDAWKTAVPHVIGTGRRVQWIDSGPPKTETSPTTETSRFYRIRLQP